MQVLDVFGMACRERKYSDGAPLPISVSDISAVVAVHPINITRFLLDSIIFELDEIVLKECRQNKKMEKDQ